MVKKKYNDLKRGDTVKKKTKNVITKLVVKKHKETKSHGDPEVYKKGIATRITKENAREYALRSKAARQEGKFFKACILQKLNETITVKVGKNKTIKGNGLDVITKVAMLQAGSGDKDARKWVTEYVEGKPEQAVTVDGDLNVKDSTVANLTTETLKKLVDKL